MYPPANQLGQKRRFRLCRPKLLALLASTNLGRLGVPAAFLCVPDTWGNSNTKDSRGMSVLKSIFMVTCHDGTDLNCGIISFEKTFVTQGRERGGRSAHPEREILPNSLKSSSFLQYLAASWAVPWTKVHPGGDG